MEKQIINDVKQAADDLTLYDIYQIEGILQERKDFLLATDLNDLPKYGELVKFETFIKWMEDCYVCDSDGQGYYATDSKYSRLPFKFWDLNDNEKCEKYGFTHIMWFNK